VRKCAPAHACSNQANLGTGKKTQASALRARKVRKCATAHACYNQANLRTEKLRKSSALRARKVRKMRTGARLLQPSQSWNEKRNCKRKLRTKKCPQSHRPLGKEGAPSAPAHACYNQAHLRTKKELQAQALLPREYERAYFSRAERLAVLGEEVVPRDFVAAVPVRRESRLALLHFL